MFRNISAGFLRASKNVQASDSNVGRYHMKHMATAHIDDDNERYAFCRPT
jgi:hypothetical protein